METGRAKLESRQQPGTPTQGSRALALLHEGRRTPDRYRVRRDDRGPVLFCVEAPTIAVCIRRGRTVSATAARGAEPGSIFLDGAAKGPPFLDPKRSVYNLDHHEDCVRAFTLATCEQAFVLVRKIVDLRKRDWTVYANDADLDTVLAIWILLNHLRLTDDDRLRARVLPLVRLEGAIDTHGLGHLDLLSLPEDQMRIARAWMDQLLAEEAKLKNGPEVELSEYVADRLRDLDGLVYSPTQIEELAEIEELARVPLTDASVAIACRSEVGIYEVEDQLRRYHGERLGMIVLQKSPSQYSLRQVDPALPNDLDDIYLRLNLVDPAATGRRSANRWGGSGEIGGSPRATGTRLSVAQIATQIAGVFHPPGRMRRLASAAGSALLAVGCGLAALAGIGLVFLLDLAGAPAAALLPPVPVVCFAAALGFVCAPALAVAWRSAPGLYGLRLPSGRAWWGWLPFALAAALAGGVWSLPPPPGGAPGAATWIALGSLVALPLLAEVLFRGLLLGRLARTFRMMHAGGPWFVSVPVLLSAALYAPWCLLPFFAAPVPPPALRLEPFLPVLPLAGGLVFGLVAGVVRERSESVLAPLLFHWLCAAVVLLATLI